MSIPEKQAHNIDAKFKGCSLVTKKKAGKDVIEIVVEFVDSSAAALPDFFNSIMQQNNISLGASSSIDGFSIFSNGEIVDIHPEEFDDD